MGEKGERVYEGGEGGYTRGERVGIRGGRMRKGLVVVWDGSLFCWVRGVGGVW